MGRGLDRSPEQEGILSEFGPAQVAVEVLHSRVWFKQGETE
jgi:hypothetical protein